MLGTISTVMKVLNPYPEVLVWKVSPLATYFDSDFAVAF